MSSRVVAVMTLLVLVYTIIIGSGMLPPDAPLFQAR
jgi:hypothetical protein